MDITTTLRPGPRIAFALIAGLTAGCLMQATGAQAVGTAAAPGHDLNASSGWTVRTVAGGVGGPGPASMVSINQPCGVTWSRGNLLVGTYDGVVRAVSTRTGRLTSPLGAGYFGFSDDGSPARSASLGQTCEAIYDHHGNLVFSDSAAWIDQDQDGIADEVPGNHLVRVLATSTGVFYGRHMTKGRVYTIAGNGTDGFSGDGGPATQAALGIPAGLAVDSAGNVLIADIAGPAETGFGRIRVVAASNGTFYGQAMTAGDIYTIAGAGPGGCGLNGLPATSADLGFVGLNFQADGIIGAPSALRIDHSGNLVIAATDCRDVEVLAASNGTFYGRAMKAGHIYVLARTVGLVCGVALDPAGNVVFVSLDLGRVMVVAAKSGHFYGRNMLRGHTYLLAGTSASGYGGDGGPARLATFNWPMAVAVDGRGNIAIADYGNHRVRLIAANSGTFYGKAMKAGDIYTIAGNGLPSFSGDGGRALAAEFGIPTETANLAVAADRLGDVLIADAGNGRLRLIPARDGVQFGQHVLAGHVYSLAGRKLTTFSPFPDYNCPGPGFAGFGLAPCWVAVDREGNAVVSSPSKIKVLAAQTGSFYGRPMEAGRTYVIAGGGTSSADGVPATKAKLAPTGVAIDAHGNIVTGSKGRIRVVAVATGIFYGTAMKAGRIYSIGTGDQAEAVDRHGNAVITTGDVVQVIAARDGTFYGQVMITGHTYTVAGDGSPGFSGDRGPATSAGMSPASVAVDAMGNLLISDPQFAQPGPSRLRVVAVRTGTFYGVAMTAGNIYTVAGGGSSTAEGVPPVDARFVGPLDIAVLPNGGVIVSDAGSRRLREINH